MERIWKKAVVLEVAWKGWRKPRKPPQVRIAGVLVEVRTEHLLNTDLDQAVRCVAVYFIALVLDIKLLPPHIV